MSVRWKNAGLSLLLTLSVLSVCPPAQANWYEPGYVPPRQSLPNGIDLLESSLYWLQDFSGVENPRDPASIVALMEDQAARFFDFAYIAYLVGGPRYAQLNVLKRSHFQNRVRDEMFSKLATRMGMFSSRIPRFQPLFPVRTGQYSWAAGGYFMHRGGPFIRLRFHFYFSPRGWRIYDVTSNGVSMVTEMRRQYLLP
jgi:ABC-type transporter MlaC component